MRGAWIEMVTTTGLSLAVRSLPLRGAWIEIWHRLEKRRCKKSLPLRGAWIEIMFYQVVADDLAVAPLAGSVD